MKRSRRICLGCLLAAMPLAATAETHDGLLAWFQSVYSDNDRAAAEGRSERMLLLYATRGYQHVATDGRRRGLQQSIAQWASLHDVLPYGTEVRSVTTVDSVSFESAGVVVRGSQHFEMRYEDPLASSVESARVDSGFEDRWVREGGNWRLQQGQDLRPAMQIASLR